MSTTRHKKTAFKAFLSHRYKSPTVNLYFFDLFSNIADVQFEVDVGTKSTNVTRLERKIRSADAFVGIYPFCGNATPEELRKFSRYFRLELDLAVRSRKPAIVFYDRRYGDIFEFPSAVHAASFDSQEILADGAKPSTGRFTRLFRDFADEVEAFMQHAIARNVPQSDATQVSIILPPNKPAGHGYTSKHIEALEQLLNANGINKIHRVPWPPKLSQHFFRLIEDTGFFIVDINGWKENTGIVSFLHGQFAPMVRLQRMSRTEGRNSQSDERPIERTLFGAVEVGYRKDIVRWRDVRGLRTGFRQRLASLDLRDEARKRISTKQEAIDYFKSAAKRKETVFVSYAGLDRKEADPVIAALKEVFQEENVFDYRDGASIRPGQPWLQEIFDRISQSALGIPLLSAAYVKSGNCRHEAREMVARRDADKLKLVPLKLRDEPVTVPRYMQDTQYLRLWEHPDVKSAVADVVATLVD